MPTKVYDCAYAMVIEDPEECRRSPAGKPFVRVTFPDGATFDVTLNVLAMLGGVAKGTIERLGYDRPEPGSIRR